MKTPVLFLTFNRLDYIKEPFEAIRQAQPPRLYLASDGPRENISDDLVKIENVRKWLLENVDWECEVKTLFQEKNLGCGKGIVAATTWFFQNEEQGIIIEDDCILHQSFFKLCDELLDKYKDNKNVWSIGALNPYIQSHLAKESYFFSSASYTLGWATWADRWSKYQYDFNVYSDKKIEDMIANVTTNKKRKKDLYRISQYLKVIGDDVWDYQWQMQVTFNRGMGILPAKNMVCNIGWEGIHCESKKKHPMLGLKIYDVYPLVHPQKIELNKYYEFGLFMHDLLAQVKNIITYMNRHPVVFLFRKDFYKKLKEL